MSRSIRCYLLSAFLFLANYSFSQNVNGHWYGIGKLEIENNYNSYLSEMVLRQNGKYVQGELFYYFKDSLVKASLNGSFDDKTHRLSIKPFPIIYYQSPSAKNSIDCIMSGNFILRTSITESVLTGFFFSDELHKYTVPNINFRFIRSDDTASLVMQPEPEINKGMVVKSNAILSPVTVPTNLSGNILTTKPETLSVKTKLNHAANKVLEEASIAALLKRSKVFTKELEIVNNQLRLEIYDNGQIDYDSVSLFLNNKLILSKSMLTHKAIRLTIDLDPNLEYNELSMLAENLGMIPPNTAALVIYDGKIRYETLLTSDLSKSATIKLVKKK